MVNLNKIIIPSGLKLSEDMRLIEMGNLLGLEIYSNQLGGRVFIRNKKKHDNIVTLFEEIKYKKDTPSTCCGKKHVCYWWLIDGRNVVWHQVGSRDQKYLMPCGYVLHTPREMELLSTEDQLFHTVDELKHKSVKRQMTKKVFTMFNEFYQNIDLSNISIFRAIRGIFHIKKNLPKSFEAERDGLNPSLFELQTASMKEFLITKLKIAHRKLFTNVKNIKDR